MFLHILQDLLSKRLLELGELFKSLLVLLNGLFILVELLQVLIAVRCPYLVEVLVVSGDRALLGC